jgi:hypothetical protein
MLPIGWIVYAIVLMIILAFTSFPSGHMGAGVTCPGTKNMEICDLRDQLDLAKDEFRFLIAFILADYVGKNNKLMILHMS